MSPLRVLSLALRVVAIVVVIGAPWLRPTMRPSSDRATMFVVDRSRSMGDEGLHAANVFLLRAWQENQSARLGVVGFDGRADVVAALGSSEAPHVAGGTEPWGSDLARALELARAALPTEGHRSIVVLSDMNSTRNGAEEQARLAAASGIRIDVVPIHGEDVPTPSLASAKARASHVAEHQPVTIDVGVRSGPRPFQLRWKRDGVPLREQLRGSSGNEDTQEVELHDPNPPPGVHVYEVSVVPYTYDGGSDTRAERSILVPVSVEGKSQVIVFAGGGDVAPTLKAALSELGLEARVAPMEQASTDTAYASSDLVVLDDVRVSADESGLTRTGQAALVEHVSRGGGLLVTGGVFGLAPEVAGTPLARILPVEIEDRGHVEDPPVALAIMLDRSGSMMARVGDHTKLELAIEASLATADVLRPTDHVAIASVDTETSWDVPLGPVSRIGDLREHVRRVQPGGGGIYVYTALRDAYAALARAKMPIRHVILFSDTADSEEQSQGCEMGGCGHGKTAESLAREARAKGITTTVVGIGEEEASDTPFLRRLAAAAGGRFYLTTEGADLRRIFLSETRVLAQSNLRDAKTRAFTRGPHPALEGIDARRLPLLGAYVETGVRAGADTALFLTDAARPEGRPLVATWRYGLGKVGVIATDLEEGWARSWGRSNEAAQLLKQTIRHVIRQNQAKRGDAAVRMRGDRVEMEIELPAEAGDDALPASVELRAVRADGSSRPIEALLEPRGPGKWVAVGRTEGEPIVIGRARDKRAALMAESVGHVDEGEELASAEPDLHAASELARATGGRVNPTPDEALAPTLHPGKKLTPTWPFAFVLAAALVVVDLVLRRLSERRSPAPFAFSAPTSASPRPRSGNFRIRGSFARINP
jgi:Ca-activated chloride channel homolog